MRCVHEKCKLEFTTETRRHREEEVDEVEEREGLLSVLSCGWWSGALR
jgi:hypothetical protein